MINIDKLLESKRVEVSFAEINVNNEFVKCFRHNHHLTQLALANILGVKKKTIEKWEQGVNKIGGSSAVLIKLLSDNPELLNQLYIVNTGVTGKIEEDNFFSIGSTTITTTSNNKASSWSKLPMVAMF